MSDLKILAGSLRNLMGYGDWVNRLYTADEELDQLKARVAELEAMLEQKSAGVVSIRCTKHINVLPYNKNEHSGGECAACEVEFQKERANHFDEQYRFLLQVKNSLQAKNASLEATIVHLREALGVNEPWPLVDVLVSLNHATTHLLHDHDCDHVGHETIAQSVHKSQKYIELLTRSLSTPPPTALAELLGPTIEVMQLAHTALDGLMGDSDLDSDDSIEMKACQQLSKELTRLESIVKGESK